MPQAIHHFRPHLTDPEILAAVSVGRTDLVDQILSRLAAWEPGASRQHWLIIGPRGIGKTHVLRLVEHRISSSAALSLKWALVSLPEEPYGIRSIADLLIMVLDQMQRTSPHRPLREAYETVRHDEDDRRVVDWALDALRGYCRDGHQGILLMVENLNRLLQRQLKGSQEVHLLRRILIEEEWLVLICTSPTFLNEVTDPEAPLFEFFDVKFLGELSRAQTEQLMRRRAELTGDSEFLDYLARFRPRLAALHHFTGGNPRLILMLYDLLAERAVTDVREQLDMLLNELTPFYQDRMGELAAQEASLLERMALMQEGATPTALARELRMPRNQVSELLRRLMQSGYVRLERKIGRQSIYAIPERFFRIWHQMNHSRAAKGRVQYLLEFFSTWYASREERDREWDRLLDEFAQNTDNGDGDSAADISQYMEYIAAVSDGSERFQRHFDRLAQMHASGVCRQVQEELAKLDAEFPDDGDYFLHKGSFLGNVLGDDERALAAFEQAVTLKRDSLEAAFDRALALEKTGKTRLAHSAYRDAVGLLVSDSDTVEPPNDVLVHVLRTTTDQRMALITGRLLGHTRDVTSAPAVLAILKDAPEPWRCCQCAYTLGMLGDTRAVPALMACLAAKDGDVRAHAISALAMLGAAEACAPIREALTDGLFFVRSAAATALGKLGAKEAVDDLEVALSDGSWWVRAAAASALGALGADRAVGDLQKALSDESWSVRASAATALGALGADRAVGDLQKALSDESWSVRAAAAKALGRLRATETVPQLIPLLRDSAYSVRGGAAKALGLLRSRDAVPDLVLRLVDESDTVRRTALAALAAIGTPQALKGIAENMSALIESAALDWGPRWRRGIEKLLSAAFRTGNLALLQRFVDTAAAAFPDMAEYLIPHRLALDYLKSPGEDSTLARQHAEVREAAWLLINAFEGREPEEEA